MVLLADKTADLTAIALRVRAQDHRCRLRLGRRHKSNGHASLRGATYDERFRLESCSRDPIGYEGSKWNLFRYVANSPLDWVDPFGLEEPYKPPIYTGPFGPPIYPPDWHEKPIQEHVEVTLCIWGALGILCTPTPIDDAAILGGGAARCCSPALREAAEAAAKRLPEVRRLIGKAEEEMARSLARGDWKRYEQMVKSFDRAHDELWRLQSIVDKAFRECGGL